MLEFRGQRRALLADKLADAANVALGALVFGQFLSDGAFSLAIALAGLAVWMVLLFFAAILSDRGES